MGDGPPVLDFMISLITSWSSGFEARPEMIGTDRCKASRLKLLYEIVNHTHRHVAAVGPTLESKDKDRVVELRHVFYVKFFAHQNKSLRSEGTLSRAGPWVKEGNGLLLKQECLVFFLDT